MVYKTNLKFEYKNGRFRKLVMIETDPQIVEEEVDGEITKRRAASAKDVENVLRKSFATLMRKGIIRSFTDQESGKAIIIRFSEVDEVEIDVKEVQTNA